MRKNRGQRGVLTVSVAEIFLLITLSFAAAFFIDKNLVSAEDIPITDPARGGTPTDPLSLGSPATAAPAPTGASSAAAIKYGASSGWGTSPFAEDHTYRAFGMVDTGLTGTTAHLAQGLVWAGVVYAAARLIGPMLGLSKDNSNALGIAGVAGVFTYKAIELARINEVAFFKEGLLSNPLIPALVVTAVVFIMMYKKTQTKMVDFQCLPFEPPLGGSKCEECNKDPFRPCSEYRCKSLGQACELLNKETPGKEVCTWVNPKDVNSPTITPWNEVLYPRDLKYITDTSIRPPALGVKIVRGNNGCLPAFTPLTFGVTTNEPAQCKIDYNHTSKFDEMQFYFGGINQYAYNHTQRMKLPAPESSENGSLEAPLFKNDGTFSLYVRCRDANGNENVDEYAVSYCVEKGPDTTPPIIEKTSILPGSPVRSGADNVPIEVYTNEPADCKWGNEDKTYDDMENGMACTSEASQINSDLLYTCTGNLTGIKNKELNTFYFRCKDQPTKAENERNVNVQSHVLTIRGSQALNIIDVSPNGTISGSTNAIKVDLQLETSNGADEGKAICYFSINGDNTDSYIPMFETSSYSHKQTLTLGSGSYKYYFRCVDAGGNTDYNSTNFTVSVDQQAPVVTRAYKEIDALKVVTNEDAECAYSLNTCNFNFEEGIKMIYNPATNKQASFAEWKPSSVYYIKCMDMYGNEPAPNACNIVTSAVQLNTDKTA